MERRNVFTKSYRWVEWRKSGSTYIWVKQVHDPIAGNVWIETRSWSFSPAETKEFSEALAEAVAVAEEWDKDIGKNRKALAKAEPQSN